MSIVTRMSAAAILWIIVTVVTAAPAPPIKLPTPITPANVDRIRPVGEIQRDVRSIVFGPGARRIALHGWETSVDVLDAGTLQPVRQIAADQKLVHFTAASNGDTVAWSENGSRVEVRDLRTDKVLVLETGSQQPGVAFAPDGKTLATGGYAIEAKLWDPATGMLIRSLDVGAPAGGLTPVFSPDGKFVAIGHRNSETRIFETATGKLYTVLPNKMSQELKFSPTGRTLAVGYVDGSLALWDMRDGTLLRSCATGGDEVYTLDWSPDGDLLATAGLHGKIILWDPRTLAPLKELEAPEWVIQVRFSPDGARLFTAGGTALKSNDRKVTIWGIPAGAEK
jgi:WD40 repeat protein